MIPLLLMATILLAPLEDAVRFHNLKTPVVAALKSAEWERVALDLRNASQFSAGVENIRVMARVQRDLGRVLDHSRNEFGVLTDRSKFIADLGALAAREGLDTGARGLTNLASEARGDLIYRQQTGQAYGYANWKTGQDEAVLNAFPAQELIRVEARKSPRDWLVRWQDADGQLWGGRMIALKTDAVWARLSRFGNPWPPYDYGSGMGVRDVSRREAIDLGLITPQQRLQPALTPDIDRNLQADVSTWSATELQQLRSAFGDQVVIKNGQAQWQGSRLKQFVGDVLAGKSHSSRAIYLGDATPHAIQPAKQAGVDLTGKRLNLDPSVIKHAWEEHHTGERRSGQQPITALDYELIPHVWREPDSVTRGAYPGTLVFRKDLLGREVFIVWDTPGAAVNLRTLYVKKPAS